MGRFLDAHRLSVKFLVVNGFMVNGIGHGELLRSFRLHAVYMVDDPHSKTSPVSAPLLILIYLLYYFLVTLRLRCSLRWVDFGSMTFFWIDSYFLSSAAFISLTKTYSHDTFLLLAWQRPKDLYVYFFLSAASSPRTAKIFPN